MDESKPLAEFKELNRLNKASSDWNNKLKEATIRFEAYLFSSKIRPILFSPNPEQQRVEAVDQLIDNLRRIDNYAESYLKTVKIYYDEVRAHNPFTQKRHKKAVRKHSKQALSNTKEITHHLKKIKGSLLTLKSNQGQKQNQRLSNSIKKEFASIKDLLDENATKIGDFAGRFRIESYVSQTYDELMKNNILNRKEGFRFLKSGDIFISFKTFKFLKKTTVSRWVSRFTGSQATHVALFMWGKNKDPMKIDAYKGTRYRQQEVGLEDGEVLIVLRPQMNKDQRMKLWEATREKVKQGTGFSARRLVAAGPSMIINFIMKLLTFGLWRDRHILGKAELNMFCSEFINTVFKEAGVYLTPKSKHSETVYPADIVASPYLDFVGLLFLPSKESEEKIMAELVTEVRI